jgi:ABC-type multidrug transport system fused ATPase/permease subunit
VKLFAFVVSAIMAGIAGALYVPQVGIINPGEFEPGNSIEVVIWTAVGGRGTLIGPIIGAIVVNAGKSWFTGALPELLALCPGRAVRGLTLFLPKGIVGLGQILWTRKGKAGEFRRAPEQSNDMEKGEDPASFAPHPQAQARGVADDRQTGTMLYLNGVSVARSTASRRSTISRSSSIPAEMLAIIGPNGAGKTTMMDIITGKTRPDDWRSLFRRPHRPHQAR